MAEKNNRFNDESEKKGNLNALQEVKDMLPLKKKMPQIDEL